MEQAALSVLVIAQPNDSHAVPVVTELRKRKVDVYHLDLASPGAFVYEIGQKPRLGDLDLGKVKTIWLRRLGWPVASNRLPQRDRFYSELQWRCSLLGVASSLSARWVNSPEAVAFADGGAGKIQQLNAARRVGLTIPATLLSSDPDAFRSFLERHEHCIWKPLQATKERCVYCSRITKAENFESLGHSPSLIQEEIPKLADIRVVTFGMSTGRYLATAIHSQENERSQVDFRKFTNVPHVKHELPAEIVGKLANLTTLLGLEFAAHDLILKPDGSYVYLESNQQGQWLWLARDGQPYLETMCDFLAERS